jgi:ATP-binding cassette subfamily B multidrug efflux pump
LEGDIVKSARRLAGYAAPHWRTFLLATLTLICLTGLGMVGPYLSRLLVDEVLVGGRRELLLQLCLAVLLVAVGRGVCRYAKGYWIEEVGQHVIHDLRVGLYAHLQRLPFQYYDQARTGELMSRLTGDVEAVRHLISNGILNLFDSMLTFVMVAIILFRTNWQLTLICLSVSPFLVWCVMRFDRTIRPAHTRIRQQFASLSSVLQENITGVRVVKAFAREEYEIEKFDGENRELWSRHVYSADVAAKYFPIMDLLGSLSSMVVVWYGGLQVIRGGLSLGQLVAFSSYIWSLIWPLRSLGYLVNLLEQALTAAERLFEIMDVRPAIASPPEAHCAPLTGHVQFVDVSLHYGNEYVLHEINLDIPPGTTVALVGGTGSGKSSLINLIPRFYDVSSGQVLVDGVDVRDWDLEVLRRGIGIAPQETFLFSDSLRGNIAFGREDAPLEQVIAAAEVAQAAEFIAELPDGYETMVGERGVGLSGGQKQRVAIARALLVDPRILILDDSTSSVDMETEFAIQQGLQRVMEGRTTFIIAHRLSTVKQADLILVLEQGRIVGRGTHEELLENNPIYREIHDVQFKDQEKLREMMQATGTEGGIL